jgi:hypothetical protein
MLPATGNAQQPIVADIASVWTHEQTGMKVPPTLAGFDRTGIVQFDTAQRDVSVGFRDSATRTEATLYVFHAGLPDASLWHDRIKDVIGAGKVGTPDFSRSLTTPFAPASETVNSGIRTTIPTTDGRSRATAEAIFAHDGWLVVVRMTSGTLDRDALDRRLAEFVAQIPLGAAKTIPAPAYDIAPCPASLRPGPAKLRQTAMADVILLAGEAAASDDPAQQRTVPASTDRYCRDPVSSVEFGIYRMNDATDSYVLAVGDSGSGAAVRRDGLLTLMNKGNIGYSVIFSTVSDRFVFQTFAMLPGYEQVIDQIKAGHTLAKVSRRSDAGSKASISITMQPDPH